MIARGDLFDIGDATCPILSDVKSVMTQSSKALALTKQGVLYELTQNNNGHHTKVKLSCITKPVVDFSVAQSHSMALDAGGTVWIWGANTKGELGLGDSTPRQSPTPLSKFRNKKVDKVVASKYFSIAIVQKSSHKKKNQENFSPVSRSYLSPRQSSPRQKSPSTHKRFSPKRRYSPQRSVCSPL